MDRSIMHEEVGPEVRGSDQTAWPFTHRVGCNRFLDPTMPLLLEDKDNRLHHGTLKGLNETTSLWHWYRERASLCSLLLTQAEPLAPEPNEDWWLTCQSTRSAAAPALISKPLNRKPELRDCLNWLMQETIFARGWLLCYEFLTSHKSKLQKWTKDKFPVPGLK